MTNHLRHPRHVNHAEWSRQKRGPNGRGLCRICLVEVPKGKRTFCGKACVEAHWIGVGAYRGPVLKRDKGVCALCGLDTEMLASVVRGFDTLAHGGFQRIHVQRGNLPPLRDGKETGADYFSPYSDEVVHARTLLRELGWHAFCDPRKSLWEADHTVALIEGGKNELSNLRTLCVPCHKAETAALRKRMRKSA